MKLFQRCKLTYLAGGMGAHCLGIEGVELQSVLTMAREPRKRWPALMHQVLDMGSAAAKFINQQAAQEAAKAKRQT